MSFLRISLTLASLLLTACGSTGYPEDDGLARWKGTRIQKIIAQLGTPDQTLHEPDGHVLYIYMSHLENTFTAPQPPTLPVIVTYRGKTIGIPTPPRRPMQTINEIQCVAQFETDPRNIIVSTSERGDCEKIRNRLPAPDKRWIGRTTMAQSRR